MAKTRNSEEVSQKRNKDSFFTRPKKHNFQSDNNERTEIVGKFTFKNDATIRPKSSDEQINKIKTKKPFDKKKWRFQKYSKKYVLQQLKEKRENYVLRQYYKTVEEDNRPKFDVQKIYQEHDDDSNDEIDEENENNLNASINRNKTIRPQTEEAVDVVAESSTNSKSSGKKKTKAFKKAQQEFLRIKEEKVKRRQEFLRVKEEKEKALNEYKQNKLKKFKKLNKKTRKGQPIMKDRIEMLYEKIQSTSM